jgi:hypothetical protein
METVTNVATSATTTIKQMIWGPPNTAQNETAGTEPISGQQGKGTAEEPFDKGNEGA